MKHTILTTLADIESREDIRILFAVESGSRAWGFASPDSDYDVRYVYVRRPEAYLRINRPRDVIEGPLDSVRDFSGWDLQKALRLLAKSNPSLLEWLHSPIVYRASSVWTLLAEAAPACFSARSEMHHYLSMAESHWRHVVKAEQPRIKKYLYLLRPLLCARWLAERGTMPPVAFDALAEATLPDDLRPVVADLLARKAQGDERAACGKIPQIDALWTAEDPRLRAIAQSLPATRVMVDALDPLFRRMLAEAWKGDVP